MRTNRRTARWLAVVNACAVAMGVAVVSPAGPARADFGYAITGVEVVRDGPSHASTMTQTAEAVCPEGKRVISGGGGVVWTYPHTNTYNVVLTRFQPVNPLSGRDRFIVEAAETSAGEDDNWHLEAVAVCADGPIPGLHILTGWSSGTSSASMQRLQPQCPAGEKVLGVGGSIPQTTGGQVALQVVRAANDGNSAYLQAHEDADGYAGDWSLFTFLVCADEPGGYEIVGDASPEADSESLKSADTICPSGKKMVGTGASLAFDAPGGVSLVRTLPDWTNTGRQVQVIAIENTATSADWDFILAQAMCAS